MTLESIMTRHVVSVNMDDDLKKIRELFNQYRFHHVLVLDECRSVGIISDRDLLAHLSPFAGKVLERSLDAASLHKKAHQIMTRSLIWAAPDMGVGDAALLLLNNNISCLPVLDEMGRPVGIVTWRDLLRSSLACLTEETCVPKKAA